MTIINPKDHFNSQYYMEVNKARDKVFQKILRNLIGKLKLTTAIDVGCGIGYYSSYLSNIGLHVTGIDSRIENIELAKSEVSQTNFLIANIENEDIVELTGQYDLVFCAGLLYHLENPFRAIRNLKALCKTVCVIETRVHWANSPIALFVRDGEGSSQAMYHYAMILSSRCIINMLYASGFSNVYSVEHLSDHEELKRSFSRKSRRHFFVASFTPVSMKGLKYEPMLTNEDMTSSTPYKRSIRRFYKSISESFRWLFYS